MSRQNHAPVCVSGGAQRRRRRYVEYQISCIITFVGSAIQPRGPRRKILGIPAIIIVPRRLLTYIITFVGSAIQPRGTRRKILGIPAISIVPRRLFTYEEGTTHMVAPPRRPCLHPPPLNRRGFQLIPEKPKRADKRMPFVPKTITTGLLFLSFPLVRRRSLRSMLLAIFQETRKCPSATATV